MLCLRQDVWIVRPNIEDGIYGIFSSERGLVTSGHLTRDPDIHNSAEVIWRFGNGSETLGGAGG